MNRLYAVESTTTTTGMKAEHRLGLRASEIPAFAAALAAALGVAGVNAPAYAWTGEQKKFLAALAKDLKANAGKSAVLPGLYQDPSVAALALAINNALGNVGKTVSVASEPAIPIAQRSTWRFQGAGCGSQCGQGGLAGDSERQSDLRRARRSGFCRRLQQGQHRCAPRLALRRDRPDVALAHSRRALSGVVVGCARLRRHGFHRAADDRSALRRQHGAPCFPDAARTSRW